MKISIITAVWNGAKTIGTALESVARQRTEVKAGGEGGEPCGSGGVEIEHIVVDGRSTDGTVERIKGFDAQGIRNREEGISAEEYFFSVD